MKGIQKRKGYVQIIETQLSKIKERYDETISEISV